MTVYNYEYIIIYLDYILLFVRRRIKSWLVWQERDFLGLPLIPRSRKQTRENVVILT